MSLTLSKVAIVLVLSVGNFNPGHVGGELISKQGTGGIAIYVSNVYESSTI